MFHVLYLQHIKNFLNESFTAHFREPTPALLEFLWSFSVSIYLVGGCAGAIAAGFLADRFGRSVKPSQHTPSGHGTSNCYKKRKQQHHFLLFEKNVNVVKKISNKMLQFQVLNRRVLHVKSNFCLLTPQLLQRHLSFLHLPCILFLCSLLNSH